MYDFLIGKGLRDFQAAAVVGNLQQESALNPRASAPAEGSYGIAQWRLGRWQNLLTFAAGRDPWSLDVQLEFLWHELQSLPYLGLAELLTSTTLESATVMFQDRFERPKTELAGTKNRIAYAQGALYACPRIARPVVPPAPPKSKVAVVAGLLALVAAVGYGISRLRPPRFEPHPEFDYRSRL